MTGDFKCNVRGWEALVKRAIMSASEEGLLKMAKQHGRPVNVGNDYGQAEKSFHWSEESNDEDVKACAHESQVYEQVTLMTNGLTEIRRNLLLLEDRLSVALTIEPPECDDKPEPPEETLVPLAETLRRENSFVQLNLAAVQSLIKRLEL